MFDIFASHGISLDSLREAQFRTLLDLFIAKNALVNLSAIRDEAGIIEKHFVDSAMLTRYTTLSGRVLDLGTGGGFPGLPLAILTPTADFTLLDSTRKKILAVESFITALALPNARALWGRAEPLDAALTGRGEYDAVVSRATAYLPRLVEWSAPLLSRAGQCFFYKLYDPEEVADGKRVLAKYGLTLTDVYTYTLAGQERSILHFSRAGVADMGKQKNRV